MSLVPITRSAESVLGAFAHKAKGPVSAAETKQKVAEALRRKSSRTR